MINKIIDDLIIYLCDDKDFKKAYLDMYNSLDCFKYVIMDFISSIYNNIDNYLVDRKYYDISWVELKDPEYNNVYILNIDDLYMDYIEFLEEF